MGLEPNGTVQFNQRDPLIEITNNHSETVTVTVSLSNGSDGTLYDNIDESGNSVTFSLAVGDAQWVDIEPAVTGTIVYSVSSSTPQFSFSSTESTDSQSGGNSGAVVIRKPSADNHFQADLSKDRWTIKNIDVRDGDGDNDLDHIELVVREGGVSGTKVATDTINIPKGSSDKYAPKGSPDVTIKPDDNKYNLKSNTLYNLSFQAFDADGNFAAESLDEQT